MAIRHNPSIIIVVIIIAAAISDHHRRRRRRRQRPLPLFCCCLLLNPVEPTCESDNEMNDRRDDDLVGSAIWTWMGDKVSIFSTTDSLASFIS